MPTHRAILVIYHTFAAILQRPSAIAGFIALLTSFLLPTLASAANQTWDGGSAVNGNWSTLTNWSGDTAAPGSTSLINNPDIASFNTSIANGWGLSGTPIVIDSPTQNIGGISFTDGAGNYFIGATGGNALRLSQGGVIDMSANAIVTMNAPLQLWGTGLQAYSITANGGTLNITGGITVGANGGVTTLNLKGINDNTNTISSVIANGFTANFSINKLGANTWSFSGSSANSYNGNTSVQDGVLLLNKSGSASAIGNGGLTLYGGTVKYGGTSTNMMGSGTVSIDLGTLDFNGKTDIIGNVTFPGFGQGPTPIKNTAGGGNLTIGSLNIRPRLGSTTSVFNAGIGGTLTLGGTVTFTASTASGTTGRAQISGTALALGGNRIFNIALGTGSAFDLEVSSFISGNTNTLTKTGAGRLRLSSANTYTGGTTISGGTLLANNATGSATGSGNVTVGNTGTIGGTGTVSGSVTVAAGGTLAPGASIGTLASGAVSLAAGANFQLEINTGTATTDLLNITGDLQIDPAALLSLTDLGLSAPLADGATLTFIDYSGTWNGGTFAGHADDSTFTLGANTFQISYNGLSGTDTAVTLTAIAAPEPGSAALLLGSTLLLARRRRAASLSRCQPRVACG